MNPKPLDSTTEGIAIHSNDTDQLGPTDAYPSPPSYEVAIGRSQQDLLPIQPVAASLTPQDFTTRSGAQSNDDEERDMEEERDYEESRPLKMGRIPDARAQYTFIQPNETLEKKVAKTCAKSQSTTQSHTRLYGHHCNNCHSQPHSHYACQGAYQGGSYSHDQPYQHPIAPVSSNVHYSPQPQPFYSVPSEVAYSIPTVHQQPPPPPPHATASVLYPPSCPPMDQKASHTSASMAADPTWVSNPGVDSGSAAGSSSSGIPIRYAPPPFPPPPSTPMPPVTQPFPFAGVPTTPGPTLINPQDISIAGFKQKTQGVESCDEILEDPYQLYRFFVAHNDRPTLQVNIIGHHVDKQETYETDSHGNRKLVSRDVHVEDFRMLYDLTPYISPRGIIYTTPDPKTELIPTLREAMEHYAEEENPFKEMRMHKTISWDFEDLKCAITHAIRSTNYRYSIDISFPSTNDVVVAKSASPLAKFMRSNWTKAFCVLTCLGVCFYPARALYRKVKDKTVKSEFEMTISTRDFYLQNYWSIVDQIQYR
ncbi:hypothetical protein KVV02_004427 [Mortierella alpina]|uniref:Uncharacterized protein n=1 Tax=Mortierella alpina TaxID=64518 RepID=A0A9P8A4X3_MORAP|nr:hypothetical protein KVV02_004427 [Mortierella alpina]